MLCLVSNLATKAFAEPSAKPFIPAPLLQAKIVAENFYLSKLQNGFNNEIQYIQMDYMQGKYNLSENSHLDMKARIRTNSGDMFYCSEMVKVVKLNDTWVPVLDKRAALPIDCYQL